MYTINTIPHVKCFVQYLPTRCFCIRNLTRSLCTLVRFLIQKQLVCKYLTPALSMKYSLYTRELQCCVHGISRKHSERILFRHFPFLFIMNYMIQKNGKNVKQSWFRMSWLANKRDLSIADLRNHLGK